MNRSAKMRLLTSNTKDKSRESRRDWRDERYDNDWARDSHMDYGVDSRYRGDREIRSAYPYYDVEDKFRDRRGREHYDNGRYAPMDHYYNDYPYVDPVYENRQRTGYNRPMNRIGFSIGGEMENIPSTYRMDASHESPDEMTYMSGSRSSGYGNSSDIYIPPLDKTMAMEWAANMENADGTTGAHWSLEQTKQIMTQKGLNCDPLKFYIAMNAVYSDLCKVFKKLGINSIDAYVDVAEAFWLKDEDAVKDKLAAYYTYVTKH